MECEHVGLSFAGNLLGQRLSFTETVEQSKALNRDPRPLIILSASGMLESGRIVHHVAWNIGVAETEILIVGYHRGFRGTGWQRGQRYDERFMKASRRITAPHRLQGSPSRP